MDEPAPDPDHLITRGEFSKRTGLSRKTLRGYAETEVLTPVFVDPNTGYSFYAPAQVDIGATLATLRQAGLPRRILAVVAAALTGDQDAADTADTVKSYLYDDARTMRQRQRHVHGVIGRLHDSGAAGEDAVAVESAPSHLALVGTEHAAATGVGDAIGRWRSRLNAAAGDHASGIMYLRFLDPVTTTLAGRVEFCIPVADVVRPDPGTALTHRPAEQHARLTLANADDPYPLIAAGLEVLFEWLVANRKQFEQAPPTLTVPEDATSPRILTWAFTEGPPQSRRC